MKTEIARHEFDNEGNCTHCGLMKHIYYERGLKPALCAQRQNNIAQKSYDVAKKDPPKSHQSVFDNLPDIAIALRRIKVDETQADPMLLSKPHADPITQQSVIVVSQRGNSHDIRAAMTKAILNSRSVKPVESASLREHPLFCGRVSKMISIQRMTDEYIALYEAAARVASYHWCNVDFPARLNAERALIELLAELRIGELPVRIGQLPAFKAS